MGKNIHTKKSIQLCDALVGTKMLYRHIDRKIYQIDISQLCPISNGSSFEIENMGMVSPDGAGNLRITFDVVMPKMSNINIDLLRQALPHSTEQFENEPTISPKKVI